MFIYSLVDLPERAVVGLVDKTAKVILIKASKDVLGYLSDICKKLNRKSVDVNILIPYKNTMELLILETFDNELSRREQKERVVKYSRMYNELGYTILGKQVKLNYKMSVRITENFKVLVSVSSIPVGLFNTESEAKQFIRTSYKDVNDITEIVKHNSVKEHD